MKATHVTVADGCAEIECNRTSACPHCAASRIAELEAALRRLWDVGTTIEVAGQRGFFVPEQEWRQLVVDIAHSN